MNLRELNRGECTSVLERMKIARLACCHESQPYIVPVYLAFHATEEQGRCLYGFSVPGQKLEWMRGNPLVCVEVDEVTAFDQWISVIALGKYEELPESSGKNEELRSPDRPRLGEIRPLPHGEVLDERNLAYQLLQTRPRWSEPGYYSWEALAQHKPAQHYEPSYYKIVIDRISGHEAVRDRQAAMEEPAPRQRWKWLRQAMARITGGADR